MLANEARHFWRTSQSIRLKARVGDDIEDDFTELEAVALHSDYPQMRRRAALTMAHVALREATA